jgi:trk system potassium uptake protein TrkH
LNVLFLIISGNKWFESLLYSLAAVSTGGFSPHDASLQGIENPYAQFIVIAYSMACGVSLILAMAVGGSIGSTAGGIKVLRILIVSRLLYL